MSSSRMFVLLAAILRHAGRAMHLLAWIYCELQREFGCVIWVLVGVGHEITNMPCGCLQVAVGVNGRVWVRSPSVATTVLVANAILSSEHILDTQCEALVKGVLKKIKQEE